MVLKADPPLGPGPSPWVAACAGPWRWLTALLSFFHSSSIPGERKAVRKMCLLPMSLVKHIVWELRGDFKLAHLFDILKKNMHSGSPGNEILIFIAHVYFNLQKTLQPIWDGNFSFEVLFYRGNNCIILIIYPLVY